MSKDITIKFATEAAAMHFAEWLCGSGEQEYWDWMRYREDEEDGDITVVNFNYHGPDEVGEFMADLTIRTRLGRLSK